MKKTITTVVKKWFGNPRTTLGAAAMIVGLIMFFMNKIDGSGLVVVTTIAGAWIGITAKDGSGKPTKVEVTKEETIEPK